MGSRKGFHRWVNLSRLLEVEKKPREPRQDKECKKMDCCSGGKPDLFLKHFIPLKYPTECGHD
jgi:hypothetical protein